MVAFLLGWAADPNQTVKTVTREYQPRRHGQIRHF